jgi:hypothetical protein
MGTSLAEKHFEQSQLLWHPEGHELPKDVEPIVRFIRAANY